MCGIWTFFGEKSSLQTLIDVRHRGPDAFGTKTFKTKEGLLEMASWRLSILDLLPRSNMPLGYQNERYWIVYNGEIYNYLEIRADLEGRGYRFVTDSDTEVILAAYDCYGVDCLNRFNGMFSFCLWDDRLKELFIARDRFGVKPLYFFNHEKGIAFASEIKQFFGLPFFKPRINFQRSYDFLSYGFLDHTEETLFRGVHQLRGGHYILISTSQWKPGKPLPVYRWYELDSGKRFRGTVEEASEEFRRLFIDSVRLRLRSDVPVGSCLSGGMDSSAIVCVMDRLLKQSGSDSLQKTFSSCFDDKRYDEREYIEVVTGQTRTESRCIFPDESELIQVLEKVIWHQDEPFNSTSIYAQWKVFNEARRAGVVVMLDGQGGDELLFSYPDYFPQYVLSLFSTGRILEAYREYIALKAMHSHELKAIFSRVFLGIIPFGLYQSAIDKVSRSYHYKVLDLGFFESMGCDLSLPNRYVWDVNRDRNVSEISKSLITHLTLPMLLHWEDRNSMANSVEARIPFLDYRLVELALSLPDSFKTSRGVTKKILRESMSDVIPPLILHRYDKMGFVTPEAEWIKNGLAGFIRDRLAELPRLLPNFFHPRKLEELTHGVTRGDVRFSSLFWRLLSYGTWARVFNVGY